MSTAKDFERLLNVPQGLLGLHGASPRLRPRAYIAHEHILYGMNPRDEISVEIDPGKTLEIHLIAVGEADEEGQARVFFELNGQPRTIRVTDRSKAASTSNAPAPNSATRPTTAPQCRRDLFGVVTVGQSVKAGDLLCTIEAMKMETGISAEEDGIIKAIHAPAGSQVDAKDLLVEFEA